METKPRGGDVAARRDSGSRAHIVVDGVAKEYATARGVTQALRDVVLSIHRQAFVSILGASGCGKSTLLKIIGGLIRPSAGEVRIDGQRVQGPPRSAIYVFQDYSKSLYAWKTVEDNIRFGLQLRKRFAGRRGAGGQEQGDLVPEYIDLIGLQGFGKHYPWQLSGGMQQRVALARALVCRPDVLLLDEPFSSVDALTRAGLQDLVLSLWGKEGFTALFVTHDIEEAIYLSDRVVVLPAPGKGEATSLEIELPRPRDIIDTPRLAEYQRYREVLFRRVAGDRPSDPAP